MYTACFDTSSNNRTKKVFQPYIDAFSRDDFFKSGLVKKAYIPDNKNEILFLLSDNSLESECKFMQHALRIWPNLLDPVYPILLNHDIDASTTNIRVFDFCGNN